MTGKGNLGKQAFPGKNQKRFVDHCLPSFPETQEFVRKVKKSYQAETDIPAYLVFASKTQGGAPLDKGSKGIIISGSPREVAAFGKYMRKDKSEVQNR